MAVQKRENDLVLGTFGRGFYVLDDYSALREITPQALAERRGCSRCATPTSSRQTGLAPPGSAGLGADGGQLDRAQPAVRRRVHLQRRPALRGGREARADDHRRRRAPGSPPGHRQVGRSPPGDLEPARRSRRPRRCLPAPAGAPADRAAQPALADGSVRACWDPCSRYRHAIGPSQLCRRADSTVTACGRCFGFGRLPSCAGSDARRLEVQRGSCTVRTPPQSVASSSGSTVRRSRSDAVVLDPRDDRDGATTEAELRASPRSELDASRQRAAWAALEPGALPPPTVDSPSMTSRTGRARRAAPPGLSRALADLFHCQREHPRQPARSAAAVPRTNSSSVASSAA